MGFDWQCIKPPFTVPPRPINSELLSKNGAKSKRERERERERENAGQKINNDFLLFGMNRSLARAGKVLFIC